jgi:hypothetical protein
MFLLLFQAHTKKIDYFKLKEHGWLQANSGVLMPRLNLLDKTYSAQKQ